MRKENRIVAITIDWKIIKELILDKIKGLPKDANIVGIIHHPCQMYDLIGLYSEKFDKVPDGVLPAPKNIKIKYRDDKKNRRMVIDSLEYIK